jgi:hypothetical protein
MNSTAPRETVVVYNDAFAEGNAHERQLRAERVVKRVLGDAEIERQIAAYERIARAIVEVAKAIDNASRALDALGRTNHDPGDEDR